MKRMIIYSMVGFITFAAAGGGTLFYLKSNEKDTSNEKPQREPYEPTNQEKFITNLIDGQHLNIKNLDLNVKELEPGKDLHVDFTGAFSYKGADLASGDFSALGVQGYLHAKYDTIDEGLNLTFIPGTYDEETGVNGLTNGKVYFTFRNQDFSFNASTVLDVLNSIKIFGIPVENLTADEVLPEENAQPETPVEPEKPALDPIALLNSIVETETPTGFDYSLEIPDIGKIILESTKNNTISGVRTVGDLTFGGKLINLHANIDTADKSFVNPDAVEDGTSLNSIAGIFESVQEIYNEKKINTKFNIKFKELVPPTTPENSETTPVKQQSSAPETKLALDLNGELALDVNTVLNIEQEEKADFKNGTYALTLLPEGNLNGNPQTNEIKALYNEGFIYLKVNELLKGKLSNQSIDDIFSIVSQKIQLPQLEGGLDKVNEFFKGSDIERLINGDYKAIENILKDVEITNSSYKFIFDGKAFNLNQGDVTLLITLDEFNHIDTVTLTGLSYENYLLDFTLDLQKYVDLAGFFENLDSFKDYNGAIDIYNSIANLVNTKQINSDYEIKLFDTVEATNANEQVFSGNLKADLNGVDFKDMASIENGTYYLDLQTVINQLPQRVTASYLSKAVYLNYNDIITNKVSNVAISKVIDAVNALTNKDANPDNTTQTSDQFAAISRTLNEITTNLQTKYADVIEAVKVGNLKAIEEYIQIDNSNVNSDLLTLRFAPDGKQNYTVELSLTNTESKLTRIEVSGIQFNSYLMNFALNLYDYEVITVDETQFAPLDNLIYGVDNLVKNKANVVLNGTIADPANPKAYVTQLGADVQFDPDTSDYYGRLDIKAKTNLDHYPYHHCIAFDYTTPTEANAEGAIDPELLARYYSRDDESGNETAGMYINMHQSSILSIIDRCKNVPDTNVIFKMIERIQLQSEIIPFDQILAGNYDLIFNDWLKEFSVNPIQTEDVTEHAIKLIIDGALFGFNSTIDVDVILDAANNQIKRVQVNDFILDSKVINVSLDFKDFNEDKVQYRLTQAHPKDQYNYIDFDNLDILFAFGINTTMASTYHLSGHFHLNVPGRLDTDFAGWGFKLGNIHYELDARITILDGGKVNAFVNLTQGKRDANGKIIKGGTNYIRYNTTDIAIDETDEAIIHQTREDRESSSLIGKWDWKAHDEIFKVTKDEMLKNLPYYLCSYMLRLSPFVYEQIENGINSNANKPATGGANPVFKIEYESIFTDMQLVTDREADRKANLARFTTSLNLQKLLDLQAVAGVIKADRLNAEVAYDVNTLLLKEISLYSDSLVFLTLSDAPSGDGKLKIGLDFSVINEQLGTMDEEMADFHRVIDTWNTRVPEINRNKYAIYHGGGNLENCFSIL